MNIKFKVKATTVKNVGDRVLQILRWELSRTDASDYSVASTVQDSEDATMHELIVVGTTELINKLYTPAIGVKDLFILLTLDSGDSTYTVSIDTGANMSANYGLPDTDRSKNANDSFYTRAIDDADKDAGSTILGAPKDADIALPRANTFDIFNVL